MAILRKISKLFLNIYFFKKLFAYLLLALVFFSLKHFVFVLFLTFIFSYLFLTFGNFLKLKFDFYIEKFIQNQKVILFLKKLFGINFIIILLYLIFVGTIFFALSDLLPELINELKDLPRFIPDIPEIKTPIMSIISQIDEIKNISSQIVWIIKELFIKQDYDVLIQIFDKLTAFGDIFFKIILSLILSYIFIIDRDKLGIYLKGIEQSNFSFLYYEYKNIIEKIVKTFGLVFKAQSMIALTNSILTIIGLFIIGLLHHKGFPLIYTLAIIVFICGFIPVLGTFISSIPILIIGYSTFGNITVIFEIIFLISFIHAIEAYYLNPKIVSSYIKLPLSLTFLVLILSEHFMGFAGLVIGISSFYLILELLKDTDKLITKSKIIIEDMNNIEKETKDNIKSGIRVSRKIDN